MLTLKAYAKINLALDVLFKRDDGYHEVAMIMQAIGIYDTVTLTEQSAGITVTTDAAGLASDQSNLAYRAAALVQQSYGINKGVHISLTKRIPIAAGLAGGSTDAAAVLRGLNQLWNLNLSADKLHTLAARLGSDVPFCLRGGTMLATGRGEILTALPDLPHCYVVLAKPPVDVSTAWVYGNYKAEQVTIHPDLAGMQDSLRQQQLEGVAARLSNVLESVTIAKYPEIARIKKYMLEQGALACLMSGSGPTVFALVKERRQAELLKAKLEQHIKAQILLTETVGVVGGENGTALFTN